MTSLSKSQTGRTSGMFVPWTVTVKMSTGTSSVFVNLILTADTCQCLVKMGHLLIQHYDIPVTILWHNCYNIMTYLLQYYDIPVTTLWHTCYNIMTYLLQHYDIPVITLWHTCYNIMTYLLQYYDIPVTTLWHTCYNIMTYLFQLFIEFHFFRLFLVGRLWTLYF